MLFFACCGVDESDAVFDFPKVNGEAAAGVLVVSEAVAVGTVEVVLAVAEVFIVLLVVDVDAGAGAGDTADVEVENIPVLVVVLAKGDFGDLELKIPGSVLVFLAVEAPNNAFLPDDEPKSGLIPPVLALLLLLLVLVLL